MAFQTELGFYVWDRPEDQFEHDQLAANWVLLDEILHQPPALPVLNHLPDPNNPNEAPLVAAGRVFILSANVSGFVQWSLLRYDGSSWRAIGPMEIMPALPTENNYNGRIVILSASSGGFDAWSVVKYLNGNWGLLSGGGGTNFSWDQLNHGNNANQLKGLQTSGDVFINASARGFTLVDRTTGEYRRLYLDNGDLYTEVVT
jgi:hypothetical protein